MEIVVQLASSLGVAGVLAWYLYYTTTVSFPQLNAENLSRMDALASKQNETIASVCREFTTALREERVLRREEMATLREEIRYQRQRQAEQEDGE